MTTLKQQIAEAIQGRVKQRYAALQKAFAKDLTLSDEDAADYADAALSVVEPVLENIRLHLENAEHGLNLKRPDIAALRPGESLVCSINGQRAIGYAIEKALARLDEMMVK